MEVSERASAMTYVLEILLWAFRFTGGGEMGLSAFRLLFALPSSTAAAALGEAVGVILGIREEISLRSVGPRIAVQSICQAACTFLVSGGF